MSSYDFSQETANALLEEADRTIDCLRAQLAEAQAEIERLKGQASGLGMINILNNETANRELAASQATNEKLRDWVLGNCMHADNCDVLGLDDDGKHLPCSCGLSVALALPNDTTALNKLLAGVYEECAKVCESMNYTDPQPHHYAYAIRALAKQKGLTS